MKTKNIIKIIIDNICHDKYSYNPKWKWEWLPNVVKENYNKVLPILLKWEERGFIKLINDDENIFLVFPEKLPLKDDLIALSNI